MSEEELGRLRTAYEFEVALYEGKGEVISFEQWLREKGEDSPIISVDKPMGEVTIGVDKVRESISNCPN